MNKILLQFDTDQHPSSFDRVVAVDAGVDHLFSYSGITPDNVVPLVHGAIFTRKELLNTAIFIGGSQVVAGESVLQAVKKSFVGPLKVSVMLDSNGSNTTAAAAVIAAERHLQWNNTTTMVLAATGPVGQRVVQILAGSGSRVIVTSRSVEKAKSICQQVLSLYPTAKLEVCDNNNRDQFREMLMQGQCLIAAGAAGVTLISDADWQAANNLKVAIDLNAVPPLGIPAISVMDKKVEHDGRICYGALGVGGLKMKIHLAAIQQLFTSNKLILDTQSIYELGKTVA